MWVGGLGAGVGRLWGVAQAHQGGTAGFGDPGLLLGGQLLESGCGRAGDGAGVSQPGAVLEGGGYESDDAFYLRFRV